MSEDFVSKLVVVAVVGTMSAALGAACGGDDEADGSSGSGGATSTSTGGSTSSADGGSTSERASSSTGSSMLDGNDTFATAEEIFLGNQVVAGELDPTGDVDFYVFDGNAGDALYIDIDAQSLGSVSFDPVYIDVIVTLFDADENQLAENTNYSSSDADPRLYTVLPADGTYYLRVTECFTWASDTSVCGGTADKEATNYDLLAFVLDPSTEQVVEETEPNDTTAMPTAMKYLKYDDVSYYVTFAYGAFSAAGDVDVFSFTPPTDVMVDGRTTVRFEPTTPGADGNGSSTPVGRIAIVDPLVPGLTLAEADAAVGGNLWVPLTFGQEYWLFVEHPGGATGAHDFYFYLHNLRGSNPVEAAEATNDVVATPEVLLGEPNGDLFSYFIDGDLIANATDVDHYEVDVTALGAGAKLSVSCGARWYGSGVRDFTWTVLQTDGTPVAGATATEPADDTAYQGDVVIPPGATKLIVAMSAASQAATVSSGFYHCGIHLVP